MRARVLGVFAVLAAIAALAIAPAAAAEGPDYDAIADNLVNQSLQVQPGEVVRINGGVPEADLMAALQVAVAKAGGQPVLTLNLPHANKRTLLETPQEHLEQLPTANLLMTKMADVLINVASVQDPELFADVPEERMAARRKAGAPLARALGNLRFRSATLGQTGGIPTAAYAKSVGADFDEVQSIFWQAVAVSPSDLAAHARKVTALLTPGTEVRMTSPQGTDLTFKVSSHPARINAARTSDVQAATGSSNVWLPAGEAYGCVADGSANGTLVVPWTNFRGVPVENLKLTFEQGKVTAMTASSDASILDEFMKASSDATKHLSVVDFGLNPHSRTPSGSNYYSWEMGGMVTLGLGNNNWAGGDNAAEGALSFHVPGTTVSVGGKTLVEDGKLVM